MPPPPPRTHSPHHGAFEQQSPALFRFHVTDGSRPADSEPQRGSGFVARRRRSSPSLSLRGPATWLASLPRWHRNPVVAFRTHPTPTEPGRARRLPRRMPRLQVIRGGRRPAPPRPACPLGHPGEPSAARAGARPCPLRATDTLAFTVRELAARPGPPGYSEVVLAQGANCRSERALRWPGLACISRPLIDPPSFSPRRGRRPNRPQLLPILIGSLGPP